MATEHQILERVTAQLLRAETKNQELEIENQGMRRALRTGTLGGSGSHWKGCWRTHIDCAVIYAERLQDALQILITADLADADTRTQAVEAAKALL